MLKKRNKLFTILFVVLALAISSTTIGLAATYSTGAMTYSAKTFVNINYCEPNTKAVPNADWKIRADWVSGMQGYGIRFQCYDQSTDYQRGGPVWIKTVGGYKYGACSMMTVGSTYYLKARIDDDYDGPMFASGDWNAN